MEELRKAREESDISQGELAKRLNISQTMLSRLEVGEREPEPGFTARYNTTLQQMIDERDAKAKAMLEAAAQAPEEALASA